MSKFNAFKLNDDIHINYDRLDAVEINEIKDHTSIPLATEKDSHMLIVYAGNTRWIVKVGSREECVQRRKEIIGE